MKVDVSLRFWWAQEGRPLWGPRASLKCQHGEGYLRPYRRAVDHLQQMEIYNSDGEGLPGGHTDPCHCESQWGRRTREHNPCRAGLRRRRKFWQHRNQGTSAALHTGWSWRWGGRETAGTPPTPSRACAPSCTSSGGSETRSWPGDRWAAARRPSPASGTDAGTGWSGTPSPAPPAGCWWRPSSPSSGRACLCAVDPEPHRRRRLLPEEAHREKRAINAAATYQDKSDLSNITPTRGGLQVPIRPNVNPQPINLRPEGPQLFPCIHSCLRHSTRLAVYCVMCSGKVTTRRNSLGETSDATTAAWQATLITATHGSRPVKSPSQSLKRYLGTIPLKITTIRDSIWHVYQR